MKRGGNQSRDFAQTYFERRYTPTIESLTPEARKDDRQNGGGGNPGLMAHCASLLKRDHPGLYEKAKTAAMADVANGVQATAFKNMAAAARKEIAAQQRVPTISTKKLTKKIAEERNANKHAQEAAT